MKLCLLFLVLLLATTTVCEHLRYLRADQRSHQWMNTYDWEWMHRRQAEASLLGILLDFKKFSHKPVGKQGTNLRELSDE